MKMEIISGVLACIIGVASAANDLLDYNDHIKPCRPGEILENDCNRCVCSKNHIFQCTSKNCNVIYLTTSCRPDTVFELDDKICICDSHGFWPHHECSYVFQNLHDLFTCKPNSYFKVDCNVCRCSAEGKPDINRCTKNQCNGTDTLVERRSSKLKVGGSCTEKTWYSLAPCQFCYCAKENKLICNTVNKDLELHSLGTYNLSICGKDLPKEMTDLLPEVSSLRLGDNVENKKKSSKISKKKNEKKINNRKKEEEHKKNVENKKEERDEDTSNTNTAFPPFNEMARNRHKKKPNNDFVMDNSNNESGEHKTEVLSESSNEIPVETEIHKAPDVQTSFNFNDLLHLPLKFNLPLIMDKVFQMALRKSMISVQNNVECEPGTTKKVKCNNVCVCTNDKKMLCTKNEC